MRTLVRNDLIKYDLLKTFIILMSCFSLLLSLVNWTFIRENEKLVETLNFLME